jgi:hypothetical protein
LGRPEAHRHGEPPAKRKASNVHCARLCIRPIGSLLALRILTQS